MHAAKRHIIVMDIDDILHDMNRLIREEAAKRGIIYRPEQVIDWGSLVKIFGIEIAKIKGLDPASLSDKQILALGMKEFTEVLHTIFHDDRHCLYPDAVSACKHLNEMEYEIHYFTDRPAGYEDVTRAWLMRHGFPQTENLHVCTDKREEICHLPLDQVLAIIDDRPRTMVWATYEVGIPNAFALRTSYNQNMSDVPRIHLADDWQELMALLDAHAIMQQMRD